MNTHINKLANVLLVEDNLMDLKLTEMIFEHEKVNIHLDCLRDGEECVEYLSSVPENFTQPPDLVLLDLNLPRMDGREVLQFIKQNKHLKEIPVAIVSGSSSEADINETNRLGASIYLVKPINLSSLEKITETINSLQLLHHDQQHYLVRVN